MTDKQIIIDGVDVSGCPHYIHKDGSCSSQDCECIKCVHNACFYKDYKTKEQECKELQNKFLELNCKAYSNSLELGQLKAEKDGLKTMLKDLSYENQKFCYQIEEQTKQLEPFKDEYFKGLDNVVIAKLAKKSIRITAENSKLEQTLIEIKEIAEPYRMTIKKICGNCKKYDDCHACCYKDINCYKYTSSKTDACEEFTYLDEFVPNILANNILQKISEC